MVEEINGAGDIGDRTGGGFAITVDDLLERGIADGGIATSRCRFVLHIGGQNHLVVAAAGAFTGGHDLIHIPAIVGTSAAAIGPVL